MNCLQMNRGATPWSHVSSSFHPVRFAKRQRSYSVALRGITLKWHRLKSLTLPRIRSS